MHEIHEWSNFRLDDDYGISLPSVGQRLMFSVFSWAHCGSFFFFIIFYFLGGGWVGGGSLALDCQRVENHFLCFITVCLYI